MPFTTKHPLYGIWRGMRGRCMNPKAWYWPHYGGRGISICPEWGSFEQFVKDIGPRPSRAYSLDRIDNDGDYEPSNCRWATKKDQQRNRRVTKRVTLDGKEYLLVELEELSGVKADTIAIRAAKGMSYAEALAKTRYPFFGGWRKAVDARVANQLNATTTHCKHGHPWSVENTRYTPEGWKNCRQCHNAKMRKRTAAAKRV